MSEPHQQRGPRLLIRSYRPVFRLEKRWYTIDRWRIPWAYGLPQRAVGYFAVALLALLALNQALGGRLARLDARLDAAIFLLIPAALAGACFTYRPDGRELPLAAWSLLRWRLGPRRLAYLRLRPAGAPCPQRVAVVPDAHGSRYRRGSVVGPARLAFRYPIAIRGSGRRLRGRPLGGGPLRDLERASLRLVPGARLQIR